MKKRLLLIMFAIVMSLAMLTACGGDKGESGGDGDKAGSGGGDKAISGEVKIVKNVETKNLLIPVPEGYTEFLTENNAIIMITVEGFDEPEKFNADPNFYVEIDELKLSGMYGDSLIGEIESIEQNSQPIEIDKLMGGLETKAYYKDVEVLGASVTIYVIYGEARNGLEYCRIYFPTKDKSFDEAVDYLNESPHAMAILAGLKFK